MRDIIPDPQIPIGGTLPIVEYSAIPVSLATSVRSIAPWDALIPFSIPPPSNAGPAEHAQPIRKSLLPRISSPFVPISINRQTSSELVARLVHNKPEVMSPPT